MLCGLLPVMHRSHAYYSASYSRMPYEYEPRSGKRGYDPSPRSIIPSTSLNNYGSIRSNLFNKRLIHHLDWYSDIQKVDKKVSAQNVQADLS